MASKKLSLQKVLNRFPEHTLIIEDLYQTSDSFRSLCEDYVECSEIVQKLDYAENMIQSGYQEEYETLLLELEIELISKLQEEK